MQLNRLTNSQLLHRICQKDAQAFSEIYDRHASMVIGFLIKIVHYKPKAEQLLEETFFALWETPDDVNESVHLWLLQQACRQCVNAGHDIAHLRESITIQAVLA